MKLLVIGDEQKTRRLLSFGLCDPNWEFTTVFAPDELRQLFSLEAYHVAVLDWEMKTHAASEFLPALRQLAPALPIIVLTANAQGAATARRGGAADCVLKPVEIDKLRSALQQHAAISTAEPEPAAEVRAPAPASGSTPPIPLPASSSTSPETTTQPLSYTSSNPAVQKTLETAWRVAPTSATVLILGENGTGKTMLARAIHDRSTRAGKPFVTVNCPCLKRELLESELFGHVKGAFTGAVSDTLGKVTAAEGGTLFLDEVGELPLDIQPKLLRLLQERTYERVGEPRPRTANVRVIAATNRDLSGEVKAGRFREDLYYRLNVISLEALPLRQRPEDIIEAAEYFLSAIARELNRKFRGFTPLAAEALQAYNWPGNLRELRNAVERAAILCDRDTLDLVDFPTVTPDRAPRPQVGEFVSLEELQEEHIRQVIERASTFEHAARILGIDKSTLYRKRKRTQHGISEFPSQVAAAAG